MSGFNQNIKLLVDGKQAFPEIISCIENAEKSIYINMFIWRDDNIGNVIAGKIYEAAERGVKITISKDTYGIVCEYCEECRKSFFHKKISLLDRIKVEFLKILYPAGKPSGDENTESGLYEKIISHPNITVEADTFKADHSKFYIFDDEILILGGINIEDKENGQDLIGRVYQDYMIKLQGREYVKDFKNTYSQSLEQRLSADPFLYYGLNYKKNRNQFEMEKLYLNLINQAQERLTIVMAYFSPLPDFVSAVSNAANRGVKVTIVIPANANFQDDSNKATVKTIMKKTNNQVDLYFSPKMLHTKMLFTEKVSTFGSCNITKKAFHQLDELNLFIKNVPETQEIIKEISDSVDKTTLEAEKKTSYKLIKYNKFMCFCEGFLV